MTGLALAVTLLIPVGVAQAAPAPAKPVSQARQTGAGPSSNYALYGWAKVPLLVAGSTHHGCPYYYACMYTPTGWSNNTPEHKWYYYGCYNLYNEYGNRWIFNNQSGSATFSGNTGSGCSGTVLWTETPGLGFETDITPVNAVYLAAH